MDSGSKVMHHITWCQSTGRIYVHSYDVCTTTKSPSLIHALPSESNGVEGGIVGLVMVVGWWWWWRGRGNCCGKFVDVEIEINSKPLLHNWTFECLLTSDPSTGDTHGCCVGGG